MLTKHQLNRFAKEGFVRIDRAFSREIADQARAILWKDTGCDPDDKSTWTKPLIRLGKYAQAPFVQAANTPTLHEAFDQLVGASKWLPCMGMWNIPVRFPCAQDPADDGWWHVDASFGSEEEDFLSWRVNSRSKDRALLMLFLFSNVSAKDAPTRIRVGSHLDVARMLEPAGEAGLTVRELTVNGCEETAHCDEVLAIGDAGTVYLCHPLLVHAAQAHRGSHPRFMANPPLLPASS